MSDEIYTVEIRDVQDIVPGDVIWAQDDGDWLTVHRVGGTFGPELYRADNSLASFDYDDSKVLVRL